METLLFFILLLWSVTSLRYVHKRTGKTNNCAETNGLIWFEQQVNLCRLPKCPDSNAPYFNVSERIFRETCMLKCTRDDVCAKDDDQYLIMSMEHRTCVYAKHCVNFWGIDGPPAAIYDNLEFWRALQSSQ